jgi:hypothetical protein
MVSGEIHEIVQCRNQFLNKYLHHVPALPISPSCTPPTKISKWPWPLKLVYVGKGAVLVVLAVLVVVVGGTEMEVEVEDMLDELVEGGLETKV